MFSMKKKTMRVILTILFILGIVVGYVLPGDLRQLQEKVSGHSLKPAIIEVPKKFGQLDIEGPYFKATVLSEVETGGVQLLRFDGLIPKHMHVKENHFVYIYKGRAKGTVGDVTSEVGPGNLVVIPAGIPHSFERIGDTPVEIILFSTPPFVQNDTIYLDTE